jgi:predicted phosphodiesterase
MDRQPGRSRRAFSAYDPGAPPVRSFVEQPQQSNQPYRPHPPPSGSPPYHLALDAVLPADAMAAIRQNGRMVFHVAGDTGGVKAPQPQQIVAMHLVYDLEEPDPVARPAFLYHLGDVVYYYGEAQSYYDQFYEPYVHYQAPILAIPGNHDGDLAPGATVASLAAFAENFCAAEAHLTPEAGDTPRLAMTQPNVYWTLDTPLATFVGLYTNVPEGGALDDQQKAWLESELTSAPADKWLLLAAHHPVYSLDDHHSGSAYLKNLLEETFTKTGRTPDVILTGHVHNYQRFTRSQDGREVPYIVAGGGGYWHLHYMSKALGSPIQLPYQVPDDPSVQLESYCDNRQGYLKLDLTADRLVGTYVPVPRLHESWTQRLDPLDTFTLDFREHHLAR